MTFELTIQEPPREHDRVDQWDDDPTPRGTVAAVLRAAIRLNTMDDGDFQMLNIGHRSVREWFEDYDPDYPSVTTRKSLAPIRVLDLGAGFGCWSSELRKLAHEQGWPVHITAVEINPEREADLRKWCDEVARPVCWRETLELMAATGVGFDLVIGNPPFAHVLRQGKGPSGERTEYLPMDETMVPTLLEHAPAVMLWHTAGAFDDSEAGREVWRKYQPAAEWKCGRVSCRADGKTDSRSYMTSLWLRGHEGPTQGGMLPRLQPHDRKWTTPPGSESPAWARENGYPLAPGYKDTP